MCSIPCTSCVQAGDLFKSLKKDRDGALRWNKKCAAHAQMLAASTCLCRILKTLQSFTAGITCSNVNCRSGGPGVGRKIALDVARGLTFLHSNRIAHMDLKTLNGMTCQTDNHPDAL